ncbi:MAG TPA: IPT/TIG domain-containing protein [Thermoanaerobaculia bacterium]
MPEPLPLSDLLASLRDQGMPVGVREHLMVGRLLARWDDTDAGSLRVALGAVLARNPDEVRIVRESFDRLYGAPPKEERTPEPLSVSEPARRKLSRGWMAGLTAAALALALVIGAWLWPRPDPEPQPLPPDPAAKVPDTAPPRMEIPDTIPRPDWERSFAAAAGLSAGLFLWLFGVRLRREARQRARRRLAEEADALPGPHRYEIFLGDLAPPFSRDLLDDAASLLGRRTSIPPRSGDLDVPRTLERTLRAGLAPHVVLRARASTHPLLVLEDVGDEMRPWRRRVSSLLNGLEARGVPIDRWRFHADAGRVFRDPGAPPLTLKQLFRLRAESPLLVVSAGEGLLEGTRGRPAPWIESLLGWRYRAWLNPVTDPAYWRPALLETPISVWPMTPEGVLAAARQLLHGELGRPVREVSRALPQRRVSPLDVERLRWLLTLAPRRDPDLAELLRQRFCPHVPPAALLEALEAPPLASPPGVGPSAEDVHAYLIDVLGASEPPPGTAAHERWRLDRALQEIRVPERQEPAARELADLVQGPLAGEVVSAVERLAVPSLERNVLRPAIASWARREGEGKGWRWTWPDFTEIAAALVCLALVGGALPFFGTSFKKEEQVELRYAYQLRAINLRNTGDFQIAFDRAPDGKNPVLLLGIDPNGQTRVSHTASAYTSSSLPLLFGEEHRESWFYARDTRPDANGRLRVSRPVWVPALVSEPPTGPGTKSPDAPGKEPVRDTPVQTTPDVPADRSEQVAESKRERLRNLEAKIDQLLEQVPLTRAIDRFRDEMRDRLEPLQEELSQGEKLDDGQLDRIEKELADIEQQMASRRESQISEQTDPPVQQTVEEPREPAPEVRAIKPDYGTPGQRLELYIEGASFHPDAKVTFAPEGVSVLNCKTAPESIVCEIEIAKEAERGPRAVTVTNPDGQSATSPYPFTIEIPQKKG